jgi:type I restriction enzyme S subunit
MTARTGIEPFVASDWPVVTLDQLKAPVKYAFVGGPFGSNLTSEDYVSTPGVPVIRGNNLGGKEPRFIDDDFVFVSESKAESLQQNMAHPGDLIVTQRGTLGQIAEIPRNSAYTRYVISQSQMKLTVNEDLASPRYLYHYYRSPIATACLNRRIQATGVPHINLAILKEFPVPLPPLSEQKRIAAILDKADALRRKRQQALQLTEQFLRSTFLDMFGDPVSNPKGWPIVPLQVATVRITKGESPKWQGYEYQPEGVRFVTSENVLWGRLDTSEPKFIPGGFHAKLRRSQLAGGDVLVNLVGASVGRTCIVKDDILPANVNQAVAVVSVNKKRLLPTFLLNQLLANSTQRKLLGNIVESARANISLTNVKELEIILPDITHQRRWDDVAKRIAETEKRIEESSSTCLSRRTVASSF